jgi:hypothetical protein
MRAKPCYSCRKPVKKDVMALNKKMINHETKRFFCISCLAEHLCCTEDELHEYIKYFKEQGCTHFS